MTNFTYLDPEQVHTLRVHLADMARTMATELREGKYPLTVHELQMGYAIADATIALQLVDLAQVNPMLDKYTKLADSRPEGTHPLQDFTAFLMDTADLLEEADRATEATQGAP